jgi:hypothetical protein
MPTEVGIHDFADASGKVVDGGPSPAMTVWSGPMGDSFRRLVSLLNPPLGCGWPHVVQLPARSGVCNQTGEPKWLLGTPDTGRSKAKQK